MSWRKPKCDHCGSYDVERHCESPTCPWVHCTRPSCGAFGRPGKMKLPPAPTAVPPVPAPRMGHGHVVPNPDGTRSRCGGPAICRVCALERAQLEAEEEAHRW